MKQIHTKITEYADELISVPRAHLRMKLCQEESGLLLNHDGNSVVECYLTSEGMLAAGFLAKSLGVEIPSLGTSIPVRVSTGVLYRSMAIASLDFAKEESYALLDRLLEEAEMQRGGSSDAT